MIQPVFLVGARGCGKTTSGRILAQHWGLRFVDTDHWLLVTTQMTVAQIVDHEGWNGFRARESEALHAVSAPSTVIATGGGMVLSERNRQFMREEGLVIYLDTPSAVLAQRLENSTEHEQRPTLTGKPITQEIAEVLLVRDVLYRQAAHYVINADQPALQVATQISQLLKLSHTR